MNSLPKSAIVGIVGAGTMGAGIAQVAAAAGHGVKLFDTCAGAADAGWKRIADGLEKLVAKGRMILDERAALLDRIHVCENLEGLAGCSLVVEAIVEDLEIKRDLFARLEKFVPVETILATNTSSISVTSIATGLSRPERFAGLHFFNPAPVMKLVEVVSGLATSEDVAFALLETAKAWGKVAVPARSTPGFIVNRVARPYYAEALRLYEEQVADPATIDALLQESGGFRMGPFALMDLIGNDVNYAVSQSVFEAYYQDPRFRPSIVQLEMVNAGWLGRKSGRGFYDYSEGAERLQVRSLRAAGGAEPYSDLVLGSTPIELEGVLIALTDGRTASERARDEGNPAILYDLMLDPASASRIGFAASEGVPEAVIERFVATLNAGSIAATCLPDWPGLVVMRTVAMLANEAFEAALHGVADEAGIDAAMRFGVNYPVGPVEWARRIGLDHVVSVIDAVFEATHDPRYRVSYGLRRAAALTASTDQT